MDGSTINNILFNTNWTDLFFKAAGITLGVGYLVYSLIYFQQAEKMRRNSLKYHAHLGLEAIDPLISTTSLLVPFSYLQIALGVIVLFYALFLL